MTLLEILNEVLAQSGFIKRSQFAQSNDPDDIQMVAIANRVNLEIKYWFPWNELRKEYVIDMIAGITEYSMPAGFVQYISDSGWQDNGSRQIELPVPDGRWYMYTNSAFSDGGTYRCRMKGNTMEIYEPDAGQNIAFEYLDGNTVQSDGAAEPDKERFSADTDTYVLDDQLLILGTQAHWAETKLLPQAGAWMANYMRKMNEAIGRRTGARTIGGFAPPIMNGGRSPYYPLWRPA